MIPVKPFPGGIVHRLEFIVFAISALTCGAFAQSKTIQVRGISRTYILHVPSGVTANPPLMFVLTGHGETGAQIESATQMDPISDREKFIVAYPDPINGNWDQIGDTDLTFIITLLDSLKTKYHVDSERVYVAGFSQGAAITHILGCDDPDKFAAIAPVSGNIPDGCAPSRPIPMFVTFGTIDIFLPSVFLAGAETWAQLDSCPSNPTVTRPYPSTNPKSVVTRITWGPCKNGTEVIADSIQGGPHEWPMDTVTKVNNSEQVWTFFKQFTLSGGVTSIAPQIVPSTRASISAFYAGGIVYVRGLSGNYRVLVLDEKGRRVAASDAVQGQFALRDMPNGVYQILAEDGKGRSIPLKIVVP